jgi:putative intracellular protease/amidase
MDAGRLPIGTICHSLWLFCAAPNLLAGRQVTCAHTLISGVGNSGGILVYDGKRLADIHVDGCLVTGRHPGVVEQFMATFERALEQRVRQRRFRR